MIIMRMLRKAVVLIGTVCEIADGILRLRMPVFHQEMIKTLVHNERAFLKNSLLFTINEIREPVQAFYKVFFSPKLGLAFPLCVPPMLRLLRGSILN
jgi:hypothetical protein